MRLPGFRARDAALDARGCFITVELDVDPASGPGADWSEGLGEILSVAAEVSDTRLTAFVSTGTARAQPDLIRELSRKGHEIAYHHTGGTEFHAVGATRFGAAVLRGAAPLREIVDAPVIGFRSSPPAPGKAASGYLQGLRDAGFHYDSSGPLYPGRSGRLPYHLSAPGERPLFLFPVSHRPLPGGANARILDGTYLGALPLPVLVGLLRRTAADGFAPTLCLRPSDLDARLDPLDLRQTLGLGRLARWKLGVRSHPDALTAASAAWKLREILRTFPPRGRLCDALPAGPDQCAS